MNNHSNTSDILNYIICENPIFHWAKFEEELEQMEIKPRFNIEEYLNEESYYFLGQFNNCDVYIETTLPSIIIQYGNKPYQYMSYEFKDIDELKYLISTIILGTLSYQKENI